MSHKMSIRDYIRESVFGVRAKESGTLVIYDHERRYKEIATEMVSRTCRVIDVSLSIIEQREAATEALGDLAEGKIHQLILWIPAKPPADDESKQRDPFAVFAQIGTVFPNGDGDDYASVCRSAMPDHVSEINRLFDGGVPSFEIIDALSKGGSWPKLKTLLGVSSSKEIVIALLVPNKNQDEALKEDPSWVDEVREFVKKCFGIALKTRGQTRQSIAEELWKIVLFSEFVFDAAGDISDSLKTIPSAGFESRTLVYDICEDLRRHDSYKGAYCTMAIEIEQELSLPQHTKDMVRLGERDTFPFEERLFLQQMVDYAIEGHIEQARQIWENRKKSIWMSHEERLAEWTLAIRALDLFETATKLSSPKFTTLESVVHAYALTWRDLDRYQREMEHAVNQWQGAHTGLENLVLVARGKYQKSTADLQAEFVKLIAIDGWPVSGTNMIWNNQVFTKIVTPHLDAGDRVAYFLVDALRYELGVEIEKQLSDKYHVSIQAACAQLPAYTEVGMASLMPDAESQLKLIQKDGTLVTTLSGQVVCNPTARFLYLQSKKGDQCADTTLEDLLSRKRLKIQNTVRLLLVRTNDIDTTAHGTPHQILELIPTLVRQIIRGLHKVGELGFNKAVIATDHGFILVHEQEAGNVAQRPIGTWLVEKARCMLGNGQADSGNIVMKADQLGIRGEFEDFAAPKTLVPYSRGQLYYHEGVSLQECVLPCLVVTFDSASKKSAAQEIPTLMLTYRHGKTDCITTRRPVLDLVWTATNLFAEEREIEVFLEAADSEGSIVGWVGSCSSLNQATGSVRIKPGAAIAVGLRMDDAFTGKFTVRVLDTSTNALFTKLELKTGYME